MAYFIDWNMTYGLISRAVKLDQLQARSQKILLGSAFEEKVDLLMVQYSPGAVEEFIIVWCMLIAHIHAGLY